MNDQRAALVPLDRRQMSGGETAKLKVNYLIEQDTKDRLKYEHHNPDSDATIDCSGFEQRQGKFDRNHDKAQCYS